MLCQLLDMLWSDPQQKDGCRPNVFRGGGCYFGPDVTRRLLSREHLVRLIRSHECCQEGWRLSHEGRVITVFSASNYYGQGSNYGAVLVLTPSTLEPGTKIEPEAVFDESREAVEWDFAYST
ncbi:unnamed protein product [Protopolystoma xenopodis]|uniref:Serine/threonine specific protein phosphatases domain-containing protein n=1 Tax=Protopolystoma xenopodis TaxID=117903 RepID=A0A448WEF5_9PLAT|nr:unnamed protein product [Protopolystoma xenopodis]